MLIIVKPYVDVDSIDKIESSFALIKKKSDYDQIMGDLVEIAEDNQIDVKEIK